MGFTKIAIELNLPGAKPQKDAENRVFVLDWLKRTEVKWLLIFDNAEEPSLLRPFWPESRHGSILVTTRNHILGLDPLEISLRSFRGIASESIKWQLSSFISMYL